MRLILLFLSSPGRATADPGKAASETRRRAA
jgi:hypothetical protein